MHEINRKSMEEGRSRSRLPKFSKQWIDTIRGTADFFGLNYYSSKYVTMAQKPSGKNPSFRRDLNLDFQVDSKWKTAFGFYSVPQGFGDLLRYCY